MISPALEEEARYAAQKLRTLGHTKSADVVELLLREVQAYNIPRQPLTEKQRAVFDYIAGHIASAGFAPTFEAIAKQFGYRSLATVDEYIKHLVAKGYLRMQRRSRQTLQVIEPLA